MLLRSKRLHILRKYDESYNAESCGTFRMRDSITCHALLIRAMQVQLFVRFSSRVVTYHRHENVGHPISRRFTSLRLR